MMKSNMHKHIKQSYKSLLMFFFSVKGEKAAEEKEKDKEKREETQPATEATDAKEKTDVSDVKKGTLHRLGR